MKCDLLLMRKYIYVDLKHSEERKRKYYCKKNPNNKQTERKKEFQKDREQ